MIFLFCLVFIQYCILIYRSISLIQHHSHLSFITNHIGLPHQQGGHLDPHGNGIILISLSHRHAHLDFRSIVCHQGLREMRTRCYGDGSDG